MFNKGDDVYVTCDGEEFIGEVVRDSGAWVLCRILLDPAADLGAIGEHMGYPYSFVMARRGDVRHG